MLLQLCCCGVRDDDKLNNNNNGSAGSGKKKRSCCEWLCLCHPRYPRPRTVCAAPPTAKTVTPVLERSMQKIEQWTQPTILELATEDCTIPQKPMLARPTMRQELPAALRPDSSGLFTPPAEPFLPPVDTATPTPVPPPANHQSLSLAMLTERLEFRSMDEPDEAASTERTRPLIQSHMLSKSLPARTLSSMEAEEMERAHKFRQLKAMEYENVPAPGQAPLVKSNSSIELPEPEIAAPKAEGGSTLSAPAVLEHIPSQTDFDVSEEPHFAESDELPPLISELPPPRINAMPLIELTLDSDPPPLISSTSIASGIQAKPSFSFLVKRPHRPAARTVQPPSTKPPPTRPSRAKSRDTSRVRATSKQAELFPDTLGPVDRPRDSMQQCFQHLESPEWEVTIQGLQTLVRLLRHNPELPQAHLHTISVYLGKHVRNLRSQVARAACQTSGELFVALRRAVETEVDEVAGPLFHRSADTNKFLRADCNAALDKMVDSITPARAVAVIVTKGASHLNAVVRTVAARLLLSIVNKLGPERVMLSPKETRDKILLTGANFLTEGSLETRESFRRKVSVKIQAALEHWRLACGLLVGGLNGHTRKGLSEETGLHRLTSKCFAKQIFRCLCTHNNFTNILSEVLPAAVMRNISKTLQNLK